MLAHEAGGLELAQDFFGALADAVVVNIHCLEDALGNELAVLAGKAGWLAGELLCMLKRARSFPANDRAIDDEVL